MANQFSNQQGQQSSSGFTAQEEQSAVAFGLSPSEAGLTYQSSHPQFSQGLEAGPGGPLQGPFIMAPGGTKKVVDFFVDLTNMGPDELTALQKRMYDAGLYDASYYKANGPKIRYGQLDDGTIGAAKDLVAQSSRSNGKLTPDDILAQDTQQGYGKTMEGQGATTGKPPPLTVQLTSTQDLLATVDATARKLIGRKLTDNELRNFVDSYHSMEANAQQAKYNQQYSQGFDATTGSYRGPGGTVEAPPTPDAYAISQLRQNDPADVKNVEMEHGMDVFNSLLKGGA